MDRVATCFLLLALWSSIKCGLNGNSKTFFTYTCVKPNILKLVQWVTK